MNMKTHAYYLDKVFILSERKNMVAKLKKVFRNIPCKYDGIVVTGVSGITMGSIISHLLNKNLVIVRKPDDQSCHSYYTVENAKKNGKYVFLDDLVDSGKTYKYVEKTLKFHKAHVIGTIFYKYNEPKFTDCSD